MPAARPTRLDSPPADSSRLRDPGAAMRVFSRLLGGAYEDASPVPIQERLVHEVRGLFEVDAAVLLSVAEPEALVEVAAMDPQGRPPIGLIPLGQLPSVAELVASKLPSTTVCGDAAEALGHAIGVGGKVRSALLLPLRRRPPISDVVVIADAAERDFTEHDTEVAQAFAEGAAMGLALLRISEQRAAQTARQAALARAAKTLNESLDPSRVLVRICEEAAKILRGDTATVYTGDGRGDLRVEAVYGLPGQTIGSKLALGEGLAGKVVEFDEPMLTNDYQGLPGTPTASRSEGVRNALSVPLHWDGKLRGALSVGYTRPYLVTREHLSLLETFGELAAVASRNAAQHEGAVTAARTDSLTKCLNHAGFQEALARELERSRRTGKPVSLVLVDLDDFKQVNDEHGHLAGDDVLRHVGEALRSGVRPYDAVGRYGGDEFAIVAAEAGEAAALELATRVLDGIAQGLNDPALPVRACRATAGVAEWNWDETATGLLERADRALLAGKHDGRRGQAVAASLLQPAALSESR